MIGYLFELNGEVDSARYYYSEVVKLESASQLKAHPELLLTIGRYYLLQEKIRKNQKGIIKNAIDVFKYNDALRPIVGWVFSGC